MSLLWDEDVAARVDRLELPFNRRGLDPYGISKKDLTRWFSLLAWLYRHYFTRQRRRHRARAAARARDARRQPLGRRRDRRRDGASRRCSSRWSRRASRRAMAEKFLNTRPVRLAVDQPHRPVHRPARARRAPARGRAAAAWSSPRARAARRSSTRSATRSCDFGTGFVRLALKTKTPIVPFAFIGGGEAIPTIIERRTRSASSSARRTSRSRRSSSRCRCPVQLEVHYGEPMRLRRAPATRTTRSSQRYVEQVKARIAALIDVGSERRSERAVPRRSRA